MRVRTQAEGAHTDYKSARAIRAIRNYRQINDFWIASCLAMTDAEGLRENTILANFVFWKIQVSQFCVIPLSGI
jgi:hypothetical protein